MRISCNRCSCPIDIPNDTPPGAPLLCPRCGNPGRFTPPVSAAAARPRRGWSPVVLVLLAVPPAGCVGSILALALPWPTVILSVFLLAGGVVLIAGRIGREWRVRWPLGIGTVLVALWLVGFASLRLVGEYEADQRREAAAASAQQAEAQRQRGLREQAAERIAQARHHLTAAEEAVANLDAEPMHLAAQQLQPLDELDPAPDGYEEVRDRVRQLNEQLARLGSQRYLDEAEGHADAGRWDGARTALGNASPYVTGLGADGAALRARHSALQERGGPHWAALGAIQRAQNALDADHADAVAAETAYDAALSALSTISGEPLDDNARQIRGLRRRLEGARRRNHHAAERLGRTRAARTAQRDRCGPAPMLSSWDGELIGSEPYVRQSAHDPDSIDVEHCTQPSLTVDTDHCWVTTCDVLGRNGFGAMMRNRMQFEVRGGRIVSAQSVR